MVMIEGIDICDVCGQEVCDCGSGDMHSMDPDNTPDKDDIDFTEAAFDDSFHI